MKYLICPKKHILHKTMPSLVPAMNFIQASAHGSCPTIFRFPAPPKIIMPFFFELFANRGTDVREVVELSVLSEKDTCMVN